MRNLDDDPRCIGIEAMAAAMRLAEESVGCEAPPPSSVPQSGTPSPIG